MVAIRSIYAQVSADLPELENGEVVEFTRQMLNLHMNDDEATDWFIAQIRDCLSQGKKFFKSIDDTMHILGQETGKNLTGQLTTLLRTELDRLCSRSSFLSPYSVKLGPLLIDRCRVSGSNARPVFLVFRSAAKGKVATSNLHQNMQMHFLRLPGVKSGRRVSSKLTSSMPGIADLGGAMLEEEEESEPESLDYQLRYGSVGVGSRFLSPGLIMGIFCESYCTYIFRHVRCLC